MEPPRQSVHESDGQTSQLTALQGSTASQCPRRRTRSSGTQRRTPPHRPRWSRRCSRRTCRMHGRRSSRRCKHGARWPGGPPLQVQACELGGRPVAASCRAASPAAPSPPPARLAAGQRSIPRRPWPHRDELHHRQLHRRRLLASQRSGGRPHDAHGRVVSSCITGSSLAAVCLLRSRAAVDPTTHMAAPRRAASPAAPSPPPARLVAEQRSVPRRPWPRRVEPHHQQLRHRRLLALQQSSGRSHDAHGCVPSSCSTGSSIAVARSPRSRAAVDSTTSMAASRRAASPAAPSPRLLASQ